MIVIMEEQKSLIGNFNKYIIRLVFITAALISVQLQITYYCTLWFLSVGTVHSQQLVQVSFLKDKMI